ncbi:sulfite oxidase [Thalassobacter stenotrophicus]|nr:sulfite oxidase [Thalassobacter stenotrophicus]KGL00767.1 sulfite oxidase [Thalassobacter sp. 16PALIMAR09]
MNRVQVIGHRISGGVRKVPTWPVYLLGLLPPVWLLYQGITGGLGVDPVKVMEHQLGIWALQLLLAGLCITPLMRFARLNLLKFRRAVGVLAFLYILFHLVVWLVLDIQLRWGEIWADIVKRPYITVGMAAFVLAIPLVATSWNGAVRRLGAATWGKLHQLTYIVVLLGAVHFIMQEKVWTIESLLYLGLGIGLVGLRLPKLVGRLRARSDQKLTPG